VGDPRGFLRYDRELPPRRPPGLRIRDWREVYEPVEASVLANQAARCMDCGIPFCHEGCPLGNLIPEWNDLVAAGRLEGAADRLHATNNFPEFTGRLCPAPCEASCVLGINNEPVTIKQVESEIADYARSADGGSLAPRTAFQPSNKAVAVVGSGPAGLAAAQQLTRAGHRVVVFERAERIGGLLRYGIPEFKMQKAVLDQRLAQMVAEGTEFVTRTVIGDPVADEVPGAAACDAAQLPLRALLEQFDAVVLATGATLPRDLSIEGRDLGGVHFAMEYLKPANLLCEGSLSSVPISAHGKNVVIIGGGDTGADCLGTAHRQGARSVHQLEILPPLPESRPFSNPWPTWPAVFRTSAAHEEGGERVWSVTTVRFLGYGGTEVRSIEVCDVRLVGGTGRPASFEQVAGSTRVLPCDLALLALGFIGPERQGPVAELALQLTDRGTLAVGSDFSTSVPGLFGCGDAARGQSLVVWAIAEGRSCASSVDRFLMGRSELPAPIRAGQLALS
jgi:glutamate synthase (NADPH/NADH) small chain